MILTPRKLAELGQLLYGRGWAAVMAERLDLSLDTIKRKRAGESPIRAFDRRKILALIDSQIVALNVARAEFGDD